MRKRKYSHATPREFVEAWQQSSCVRQVARKVGSTKRACSRRASRYRDMGVGLKYMSDIPCEPTDWDELARYARELAPEDAHAAEDDVSATPAADTPPSAASNPANT
jgi:hypothetical protein